MKIRTQADIVELERMSATDRIRHRNVAEILRDAAASHGNRTAFRFLSGSGPNDPVHDVGYGEMLRRVTQAANLLHAHNIGPNDTVTLLLPGLPETFIALWAAEIGAVANPVNYFLDATQIAGIMKEASQEQKDEVEDFAFGILEALNANQQLDMLHLLGPKYGIDPENVTRALLAMPSFAELNSLPYMHTVVPNLLRLGLITERTEAGWRRCGMLLHRQGGVPLPGQGLALA